MNFNSNSVQVATASSAADVAQQCAESDGLQVWRIDLAAVRTKHALLEAIRAALPLPDYFNWNWDSLEECLRDFNAGRGWLLIFEHADGLALMPSKELAVFGSILSDTAEFWRAENRIFRILIIQSPTLREISLVESGALPLP